MEGKGSKVFVIRVSHLLLVGDPSLAAGLDLALIPLRVKNDLNHNKITVVFYIADDRCISIPT